MDWQGERVLESRTKNTSRNIAWGIASNVITLVLPFITRTAILYLLGANYLGIGTLFTSVLSFLSLTELGLSSAIVYTMYRPIVDHDNERISAILNYYRKLYRIIGAVILIIGTILVPVIPYLISSDVPDNINIYILYYIYLINSVISYFFAGYRASLLSAHQREDISTKRTTAVEVIVQILQIAVLFLTENFYIYALVPIIGTIFTNILNSVITRKMYPQIQPKGVIDDKTRTEIRKKLSGLVGTRLNSIVVHSADTIIISAFLGLTLTAQYGNYYTIFNAVCGIIATLFTSMTASIGNKLVTDSIEENYAFFKKLSFLNAWIVCWCSVCFLCLYEPFMKIWVGEDLCLGIRFTCLMAAYFYIYQIQKTVLTFKDAAGIWYSDRFRPYVSMIINLVSNIILVQVIGIYGIVLSTILSFMISLPWANKVLFDNLFKKSPMLNIWFIVKELVLTILFCFISYIICDICDEGLSGILERMVICCVVPNLLFFLFHFKTEEFRYWVNFIYGLRKGRKKG